MTLSNARNAFLDCFNVYDKALQDPKGVRVRFGTEQAATYFRMRMHHARQLDRTANSVIYADPVHPMHGKSPFDVLSCRLRTDGEAFYVYVEPLDTRIQGIESLSEVDGVELEPIRKLPEQPKPLQIEHKLRR